GAAAGEIASEMATAIVLRELRRDWLRHANPSADAFASALKHAATVANAEINAFAGNHPEYRGMGTTATIAGLLGDTLYLAQVGDSRAYLVRDGVARQITKDQSLMQKLVEAGEITEEEAEHSERRNIILQALGPEATVKIDLTHQQLRRDDVLVLCSDGLSGQVSRDQIAEVVRDEPDLMHVCRALIDLANGAGGPDNITVIAARFDGQGLVAASDADEVGHRVFPLADAGSTPPMGVDRVVDEDSQRVTMPVHAVTRDTVPVAADEESPSLEGPVVSEARRARGQFAQRVLLGLLFVVVLLSAAWWLFASRD
ncbi:MAG: serine/threonine-protein phosphatase, partial [Gemmatimonadota bacterium]|nr:serine/threonine-protein phosphatase [Gemmatimonadota bacterium]